MLEREAAIATWHPKIFVSRIATQRIDSIQESLVRLNALISEKGENELREFLEELIPEASLGAEVRRVSEPKHEEAMAAVQTTSSVRS
jgi:hypothetical protein